MGDDELRNFEEMNELRDRCPKCGRKGIPCEGGTCFIPQSGIEFICPDDLAEW